MILIKKKTECCACTACFHICPKRAISLVEDEEGFLYPLVDKELCVGCGKCIKVCPIRFRAKNMINSSPMKVYAAHSLDEKNWISSSSGGIFQIMAKAVILNGGIVCGAIYDSEIRVFHYCTSNISDLPKFQGSKYVQSDLNIVYSIIRKELKANKQVLFSGTPCQVEGLIHFIGKNYDNLITCDLVCHSVPSPLVFKHYLSYIQSKYNKKIYSINMKDKTMGWGKQSPRIYFYDGTNIFGSKDSVLWNDLFYSQLITRPCCHECKFTNITRPGDITIGDFWGIEKKHSELYDKRGISLIYANTTKGLNFLSDISSDLKMTEVCVEDSLQENLKHPVSINPRRKRFWNDYRKHNFEYVVEKYIYRTNTFAFTDIIRKLLNVLKK